MLCLDLEFVWGENDVVWGVAGWGRDYSGCDDVGWKFGDIKVGINN